MAPDRPELPATPPTGVDEVDGGVRDAEGSTEDAARTVWPDHATPTGAPTSRAAHPEPGDRGSAGVLRAGASDGLSEVDGLAGSTGDWGGSRTVPADPSLLGAPEPGPPDAPEPAAFALSGPGQAVVLCFALLPGLLVARGQRQRRSGFTRSRSAKPAVAPD